jgi:hypothetical protein
MKTKKTSLTKIAVIALMIVIVANPASSTNPGGTSPLAPATPTSSPDTPSSSSYTPGSISGSDKVTDSEFDAYVTENKGRELTGFSPSKKSDESIGLSENQKLVAYTSVSNQDEKNVVLYEKSGSDWAPKRYFLEVPADDVENDILSGRDYVDRRNNNNNLKGIQFRPTTRIKVNNVESSAESDSSDGVKPLNKAQQDAWIRGTLNQQSTETTSSKKTAKPEKKPDLIISTGSSKVDGYLMDVSYGGLHPVIKKNPDTLTSEDTLQSTLATYTPSGSSTKYYYLSDGKGVRLVDEASLKTMASWESDKSVKVGRLETVKIDKTKPVDEQLDDINKGFTGGGSMVSVITADMAQKADEVVKNSDYGEKPSVSFGMNSISVSKEKDGEDYLAYRAYNVNIGLDRTATGYEQNRFATVQENYDSENGKLVSKVITVHDGEVITGTLDPRGNIIECNQADCESNPFFQKIQNRDAYSYWADSLDRGAKWSKLSSLFGMDDDFAGWRQGVDELFRKTFILGGAEAWAQKICEVVTDVKEENNALFSLNEDGLMTPTASIAATKQFMQSPSGNRWIYKLSFFVRNPEASSPGNVKKYKSGVRAKSSKSLSGDERQIWNEIEGAGKDISNERARYSKTSKGEDLSFNIEFSGQRTIRLLKKDKVLGAGDEIFFMGEDSFATASSYNYDTICLVFTDNPPKNAFYDEVGSVCASIVDVTGSAPSQIVVPEKEVSDESGRGEFVVI